MKNRLNRKALWTTVVAGIVLSLSTSKATSAQTTTQTETRSGTVVYVSGNDLVVKMDDGTVKHLVVPDSVTADVDGQQLTVHQLKPGMHLTRTITTTTKTESVTNVRTVKGKVWMVNAPYVIVTLENGQNKQYKVPDGMKFNVNGQEISVFHLKKGMNLTATIVTTTPTTIASSTSNVTGTGPAVAEAPKPPTPPQEGALLIDEQPASAATTVASNHAPPVPEAPEPKPARLPKTGSPVSLLGLVGLAATGVGLGMRGFRLHL